MHAFRRKLIANYLANQANMVAIEVKLYKFVSLRDETLSIFFFLGDCSEVDSIKGTSRATSGIIEIVISISNIIRNTKARICRGKLFDKLIIYYSYS